MERQWSSSSWFDVCAFIEVEEVTFRYAQDARPALKRINLSIEQGEFLAVLGANGSGKSTLAKHFNALLLPSEGRVRVLGLPTDQAEHVWTIRSQVGMVFQNPDNQLVAATVEQDVAFGPENLGLPRVEIQQRVQQALETVGMTSRRGDPPHLLSGGQKQRVAIAGVLAMKPRCIVLDEPTAMLDPRGRLEVMETLHELHQQGITIVLITHFMSDAISAERSIVLADGEIVADGPPSAIFALEQDLEKWGLVLPEVTRLASELRKLGVDLPEAIRTSGELVQALCQSESEI